MQNHDVDNACKSIVVNTAPASVADATTGENSEPAHEKVKPEVRESDTKSTPQVILKPGEYTTIGNRLRTAVKCKKLPTMPKISHTAANIKEAFDKLQNDEKSALLSIYNQYTDATKRKDSSKVKKAASGANSIIEESDELYYSADVWYFNALIQLEAKQYREAVSSFAYADIRSALYCSFEASVLNKDRELLKDSGAFAVMLITENENDVDFENAVWILLYVSSILNDVSWLRYMGITANDKNETYIKRTVKIIAGYGDISVSHCESVDDYLALLVPYFDKNTAILDALLYYNPEIADILNPTDDTSESGSSETTPEKPKKITVKYIDGVVSAYSTAEKKGTIKGSSGREYSFSEGDVKEYLLVGNLSYGQIGMPVSFGYVESDGERRVVEVKRGFVKVTTAQTVGNVEPKLETIEDFSNAILEQEKKLPSDPAVELPKYLPLLSQMNNKNFAAEELPFDIMEKMRWALTQYADAAMQTYDFRVYDTIQQAYMKTEQWEKALTVFNALIENTPDDSVSRKLHFINGKALCYTRLGDNQSAIGSYIDWVELSRKDKSESTYYAKKTIIYPSLAECYINIGDKKSASKYLNDSFGEKSNLLRARFNEVFLGQKKDKDTEVADSVIPASPADSENSSAEVPEQVIPDSNNIDEVTPADNVAQITEPEEEESSEEIPDYVDPDAWRNSKLSEASIVTDIDKFSADKLYALLTYLTACSEMAEDSAAEITSLVSADLNISDTVSALNALFSAAFGNPLMISSEFTDSLSYNAALAHKMIPSIADNLYAAASLRALFRGESQDYSVYEKFITDTDKSGGEHSANVVRICRMFQDFRNRTGIPMSAYIASMESDSGSISEKAAALRSGIAKRLDIFESNGRTRRTRELLFGEAGCETRRVNNRLHPGRTEFGLHELLSAAADNDTSKIDMVSEFVEKYLLKNGDLPTADRIDSMKLSEFLDSAWDDARDIIQFECRHVNRPTDKIKGGKRSNLLNDITDIVRCVCEWLDSVSSRNDNPYISSVYSELSAGIPELLRGLARECDNAIADNGFNWGEEALRRVSLEIADKLSGTYNSEKDGYFFAGFLNDGYVLLDEDYTPDLESTLSILPGMRITDRILKHVAEPKVSLAQRVAKIYSDSITDNNFRQAELIRKYAKAKGISEADDDALYEKHTACLKAGRARIKAQFEDFVSDLTLFESYGSVSDINGRKTEMVNTAKAWYERMRESGDCGFFASIIDAFRDKISADACKTADSLREQIDILKKNGNDFGVYPEEKIVETINDCNFTAAENMINRIRKGDVDTVKDYSEEPFGYLNRFFMEFSSLHRASSDNSVSLREAFLAYTGKRNLEFAMQHISNGYAKDIKGGVRLIESWMTQRQNTDTAKIEKLLDSLGMPGCVVEPDNGNESEKSFIVTAKKRSGKVSYPHPIPCFGSQASTIGFRVLCLFGRFNPDGLIAKFREINTTAKHTIVFLDFALNLEDRRSLARKIRAELSFSKSFVVIDRVMFLWLAKNYSQTTISKSLMAVAMPFSYNQPFVEKSKDEMPPELFTGRETELNSIEASDGASLVYGGRQLGKSALLKMARNEIDRNSDGDRAVLIEILGQSCAEAAKTVSLKLIREGILPSDSETDDWNSLAGSIETRLMDENPDTKIHYLLLMLDEADKFIESCAEVNYAPITLMKSLPSGRFKIVMAGLHNLARFERSIMYHDNSTLAHLDAVVIKPFERPEAIKLLTNTLAYLGLKFKDDVVSNILAATNYFPGLIQLYCQKLLEAMRSPDYAGYSDVTTPPYEVSEEHFKKVLTNPEFANEIRAKIEMTLFVNANGSEHSDYHIIALLLSYLCYCTPERRGYTVQEIVKLGEDFNIDRIKNYNYDQVEELMCEMYDLNILTKIDDEYTFAMNAFRDLLGSLEKVEESIKSYEGEGKE